MSVGLYSTHHRPLVACLDGRQGCSLVLDRLWRFKAKANRGIAGKVFCG